MKRCDNLLFISGFHIDAAHISKRQLITVFQLITNLRTEVQLNNSSIA